MCCPHHRGRSLGVVAGSESAFKNAGLGRVPSYGLLLIDKSAFPPRPVVAGRRLVFGGLLPDARKWRRICIGAMEKEKRLHSLSVIRSPPVVARKLARCQWATGAQHASLTSYLRSDSHSHDSGVAPRAE